MKLLYSWACPDPKCTQYAFLYKKEDEPWGVDDIAVSAILEHRGVKAHMKFLAGPRGRSSRGISRTLMKRLGNKLVVLEDGGCSEAWKAAAEALASGD